MKKTALVRRLRRRVQKLDGRLIRLLSERIVLTNRIGKMKLDLSRPILDAGAEAAVMERALRTGCARGLPADLIRSLFQAIIAGSRLEQQKIYDAAPTRRPERILIVGGAGEMGKWFAAFLERRGHRVAIYDPKTRGSKFRSYPTLEAGLKDSELVLVSVPLDQVCGVIDRLADLRFPGVVCDIASIKGHIAGSLRSALRRGIKVTSIHPLFGPGSRDLDRKTVCLCPCGSRRADDRMRALFRDPEIQLVALSLEEHDRLISYVLGLSHLINLIFGEVLVRSGRPFRRFARIASTTFRRQAGTAQSVLGEDPRLYFAIQRLNPYQARLYAELEKTARRITRIVASNRESEFVRLMRSGRDWLSAKRPRS